MATIVVKGDDFDAYAATESYANDYVFHRWCEHLFLLSEELSKQKILDAYYLRAFVITLYELSDAGLEYAEKQMIEVPNDARYGLLKEMMTEILDNLTDDEYLLLKYFRDSYCHIFTRNYNYYDNEGILKTKLMTLYTKDRIKYSISAREFMEKAESVLGRSPHGELEFKKNLIKKNSPIIREYEIKFMEAKEKITAPLLKAIQQYMM